MVLEAVDFGFYNFFLPHIIHEIVCCALTSSQMHTKLAKNNEKLKLFKCSIQSQISISINVKQRGKDHNGTHFREHSQSLFVILSTISQDSFLSS